MNSHSTGVVVNTSVFELDDDDLVAAPDDNDGMHYTKLIPNTCKYWKHIPSLLNSNSVNTHCTTQMIRVVGTPQQVRRTKEHQKRRKEWVLICYLHFVRHLLLMFPLLCRARNRGKQPCEKQTAKKR